MRSIFGSRTRIVATGATVLLTLALAVPAVAQPGPAAGPNPNAVFGQALTGLNSLNTASIVYEGVGVAAVGKPEQGLLPLTQFRVAINYGMEALRVDVSQADKPRHTAQMLAAGRAWDEVDRRVVARPDAVLERRRLLLMTPHGLMKAAQEAGARRVMARESINGEPVTTMTVPAEGFTLKAYFDDRALITRVETVDGDASLGRSVVAFLYGEYRDYDTLAPTTGPKPGGAAAASIYGGIPFPSHIVQLVDGQTILDVRLTEVTPNAGLVLNVPPAVERAWPRKKQ